MAQTIATVAFEVLPATVKLLEEAITTFREMQEPDNRLAYMDLSDNVKTLHFMAIMVFRDPVYDPLFLLEVNFDGDPAALWQGLSAFAGKPIINILRFCAPPRDDVACLRFKQLLATGDGLPDVLATAAVYPTASHLGNRGLTRIQIEAEAALFDRTQAELKARDKWFRARAPVDIHQTLREAVVNDFNWLTTPSPPRVPRDENIADWRNLIIFATLVFAILAVPGTIVALVLPWWFVATIAIAAAFALWNHVPNVSLLVSSTRGKLLVVAGAAVLSGVSALIWLSLASAGLLIVQTIIDSARHVQLPGLAAWGLYTLKCIGAGAAAASATVILVLIALRRLEKRDSTSQAPVMSSALTAGLSQREDQVQAAVFQNHMGSLVMVKPGGLRSLLLRAGHRALHLALRIVSRDGYLNDMRTVHFAHWALMNNNSRLLFMSNFDGTWESYLDDFIEKASTGTTLAWTNCVGSPLAAFLILEGVTKGRQFKAWARASMSPNLFWFSAYPNLTVNQIERNHIIADGLRSTTLEAGKAAQWIRAL